MTRKNRKYQKPWQYRAWHKFIYLFFLALFVLFIPGQNIYTTDQTLRRGNKDDDQLALSIAPPSPYPVNITGMLEPPQISAEGIVVRDVSSGVDMYKRNDTTLFSPASTTKILTALVALDAFALDEVVQVATVSADGQKMGLVLGEQITVENLLYGAIIHSGNDAAIALAQHYPGGYDAFVSAMNSKAKTLSLTQSTFTNPVGYDDVQHKMTPSDLARLSIVALQNKTIAKMAGIPAITVSDIHYTNFHSLKNVNQLLGKVPGVAGLKTGWTQEAGENLVTLVERGDHKVIIVVLKSLDRFSDTEKIINWVFGNFEWQTFSPPQQ